MGVVVVCLMVLQPALGFAHHSHYKKHHARGLVSHAHIWYGRALIILGIVTGGLGLQLAGTPRAFTIAYAVVAAFVAGVYVAANFIGDRRRSRRYKEEYNRDYHSESPRQQHHEQLRQHK